MNDKKIAFIYCVNNRALYEESVRYVKSLHVPKGYEIEFIAIEGASSITSGYNQGMRKTDAKYKVYLHQDVFIVNKNFIIDILDIFQKYSEVGMIGVVGSQSVPFNGIWWESEKKVGKVYDNHNGKMELLKFTDIEAEFSEVQVIDGLIMITQYDLQWREDLFKGWHFYDASHSLEFIRKGYKVVVPSQSEPWCVHDCGIIHLKDDYDYDREIFCREYLLSKSLNFDKIMKPIISICIPTYNRQKEIEKSIISIVSQINDERVEIIVSDNASTDSTQEIVRFYSKKYKNIKYVRNEQNLGSERNIINALNQASGTYILLHGDDDYFKQDSLCRLLNIVTNNPQCSLFFIDVLNDKKDVTFGKGLDQYLKETSIYSTFISSIMFKKEYYLNIKNPTLFIGSFINQVYIQYKILQQNPHFCIIRDAIFTQEGNDIIGYNYGEVFIKNYLDILHYFKGDNSVKFLTEETIKQEKKKMLETTIFYWYRYILRNKPPVSLDYFDDIFVEYYKDEPYFVTAKSIFERIKYEEMQH
ncbi:glycosyltransferase involved in cell wall biosynthesis [Thermolongibacillus altinsuensis]|uniref:Glycosyltransferase involved in cell wall biosynthesis n=1 Tax=Thermolongibacillus altinsuensis TaxID=575256 RepID=A0A4R1QDB4_9BACL|nr:glycosyltransferase [Thermolongibacillus altinsuensis]TCL47672.1 glycosyltransferase involved in cell wall biosynthesis [Thermolongibacillus altinsuensis]